MFGEGANAYTSGYPNFRVVEEFYIVRLTTLFIYLSIAYRYIYILYLYCIKLALKMGLSKGAVCSAFNCSNNQKKTPNLSFFRFPKDPARSRKWLINLRREDLMKKSVHYLHNNIKLCAIHFEDGQFMNSDRKKLVWDAAPTLFNVTNPPTPVGIKTKLQKKLRLSSDYDCATAQLNESTSTKPNPSNNLCDAFTQTKHNMDVIKAEPDSDDESSIGGEENDKSLPALSPARKCEMEIVSIKCEIEPHVDENGTHLNWETSSDPLAFTMVKCELKDQAQDGLSIKEEVMLEELGSEANSVEPLTQQTCGGEDKLSSVSLFNLHDGSEENITSDSVDSLGEWVHSDSSLKTMDKDVSKNVKVGKCIFKCEFCCKEFPRYDRLMAHLHVHTGHKPFKCNVCSKQYTRHDKLVIHHRIHRGEKPFTCDICSRQFTRKQNLLNHVRIHIGQKPFKCEVCSENYTSDYLLAVHMRLHTWREAL